MNEQTIGSALESFITDVDGVFVGAPLSILALGLLSGGATYGTIRLLRKFMNPSTPDKVQVPRQSYREYTRARWKQQTAGRATLIAPRTFLVSMVSQFDVFLSKLLTSIFKLRPEVLNSNDRKLSFSEIASFESIDAAREYIVEAEIESFLRKSLSEQFSWLEQKFDVKLRSELSVWPALIEITQRRNLFVHADGIVSKQYIQVCGSNQVDLKGIVLGHTLSLDAAYLKRARDILIEVGVKLAQVLWRKLDKTSWQKADEHINELSFEFLQVGRTELASAILDFAFISAMKHPNKEVELMLKVNHANSYLLRGDYQRCKRIVGTEDWSAYEQKFRLAEAVLCGEFNKVTELMREIGNCSTPNEHDYRDWPLFLSVSERDDFRATFKEIFCQDYQENQGAVASAVDQTTAQKSEAEELSKTLMKVLQGDQMKGWFAEAMQNFR